MTRTGGEQAGKEGRPGASGRPSTLVTGHVSAGGGGISPYAESKPQAAGPVYKGLGILLGCTVAACRSLPPGRPLAAGGHNGPLDL